MLLPRSIVDIWACDTATGENKIFKIARIGEVKILGDWQMEEKHERRPIDSFRMSGNGYPIEHIKLKLTLRAKDLLTEEYPVTETEVYQVKRTWLWEGDVNAFEGIGRFVLGLHREVAIREGAKLRAWVRGEGAMILKKF